MGIGFRWFPRDFSTPFRTPRTKAAPDAQNLGLDAAQAAKAFDINNLTVVAKSQPDTDSSHLGDGWGGLG